MYPTCILKVLASNISLITQYNELSYKQNQLGPQFFLVYLFLFSACFGRLCVYGCLAYQTVIDRVTNTKCRIDTVISPDDGHIVARNV